MCIDSYADISIHTPTRGTTAGTGTATNLAEFQSTFPREERPYYTIVRIQVLQFQSTLPREERHITPEQWEQLKNFNTRSHERRDYDIRRDRHGGYISIHAPTRGATKIRCSLSGLGIISIHAPTRGATVFHFHYPLILSISIHAPTRGATSKRCRRKFQCNYFNPRSHERSDEKMG